MTLTSPSPSSHSLFDLDAETAHVWQVDLSDPLTHSGTGLSSYESSRAGRFAHRRDRERFVASHCAMRRILAGYLEIDAAKIAYAYSEFGKPYFPGRKIAFNLSHSGEVALIAVASRQVGIDIEQHREIEEADQIAATLFTPAEIADLEGLTGDARKQRFFQLWTAKEALAKARGTGIANGMEPGAADGWAIRPVDCPPGHTATLACQGNKPKLSHRLFEDLKG